MIRHKKWIMVAIILIVLAVLQYRNVNLNITNQTVIKYNFNLNEEITTPTFKLTPKSTNVEYVPDEEIYRIMINLEVKKLMLNQMICHYYHIYGLLQNITELTKLLILD